MKLEITPHIAAETIAVLRNTEISLLAKIPTKLIRFLQSKADEADEQVRLDFEKDYAGQTISEEARAIITLIHREYWCSTEERTALDIAIEKAEIEFEEELNEKYNPDNIFENSNKTLENQPEIIENSENDQISIAVIEEPKWYEIILNKIKNLFKIRKKEE